MLEAWFLIAATLLVVSGVAKLLDPAPTRGALGAAGLPAGPWTVPTLAGVEVGAGIAGAILGGWAAGAVAVVHLGFAAFVATALVRRLPIASCGCFGRSDTPPTRGHLVYDLVTAAVAATVATTGVAPLGLLAGQPLAGVPYLAFVGLGTWVVYLLLAELPRLGTVGR